MICLGERLDKMRWKFGNGRTIQSVEKSQFRKNEWQSKDHKRKVISQKPKKIESQKQETWDRNDKRSSHAHSHCLLRHISLASAIGTARYPRDGRRPDFGRTIDRHWTFWERELFRIRAPRIGHYHKADIMQCYEAGESENVRKISPQENDIWLYKSSVVSINMRRIMRIM
jgi:hypothetical protein